MQAYEGDGEGARKALAEVLTKCPDVLPSTLASVMGEEASVSQPGSSVFLLLLELAKEKESFPFP